ncbi:MAG: hypothetical protein DCC68_01830 [Planctomycetota bacterium]|nr:MAG: hypothetical protein DCC68_01830 [Planctomycetota bacterium]
MIVGRATFPSGDTLAFRWTEETGIESLGDLPGGDNSSFAFAVCGNGGAIVGVGHTGNSRQFRWTETTGMHDLGPYVGRALGCSAHGHVVVGEMNTPAGLRPIIWDEAHGVRDIQDILLGYGITATLDWRNMTARAASADGTVVVGEGRRGDGRLESWVAVLVPEPPAYTYASLAAAMLAMIRYRTGRRCRSA